MFIFPCASMGSSDRILKQCVLELNLLLQMLNTHILSEHFAKMRVAE